MIINDIITQHPESVAFLFLKYSIRKPVSVQALSAAIISKGQPFIDELSALIGNDYEYFNGNNGKKTKKKKKKRKAQAQAQAAQEGFLRRPVNTPVNLLPASAKAELQADLTPRSQEAAQMSQQVRQQIMNTPVTGGGGIWDKIGNIIGGVRGAVEGVRGIVKPGNPSTNGGASADDNGGDYNTPGGSNAKDKPFKTWVIAGIAIVVVLVIVIVATSGGGKTIAK
jgi:hypothetical protein